MKTVKDIYNLIAKHRHAFGPSIDRVLNTVDPDDNIPQAVEFPSNMTDYLYKQLEALDNIQDNLKDPDLENYINTYYLIPRQIVIFQNNHLLTIRQNAQINQLLGAINRL